MTPVKESRIAALRRTVPLLCGLALIVAYYAFTVGAGRPPTAWYRWSGLYDAQAEGFRNGHLYLPEIPSRALQSLPDPYNPANMRFWRWDHTYYKGHFYLYWGLVPALLLAAFKTLFRVRQVIGDEALTFGLFIGRLFVGTWLLRSLAAARTPQPARSTVALAVAVFALAHPTPYTLNRGAVYEVAIGGGVFFMLAGVALGWRGLRADAPVSANRWLAAASASLGLAGGCRSMLLPTVALLAIWTAFARWRRERRDLRRFGGLLLFAGGPAALLTIGHLVLNAVRFDSWSTFGARYQLGNPLVAGLRFVVPTLYTYLFLPPLHGCRFPYLTTDWKVTRALTPRWLHWPADHMTHEPVAGLLVCAPFVLLGVIALLVVLVRRRRNGAATTVDWTWRWVWGALCIYLVGSAVPLLLISATTMRYEVDFASPALLLAAIAGWWLLTLPATRTGRTLARAGYATLAVVTIIVGVLLGFGGYFDHYGRHNPALKQSLERTFTVCRP
jgi:hypothetical protein